MTTNKLVTPRGYSLSLKDNIHVRYRIQTQKNYRVLKRKKLNVVKVKSHIQHSQWQKRRDFKLDKKVGKYSLEKSLKDLNNINSVKRLDDKKTDSNQVTTKKVRRKKLWIASARQIGTQVSNSVLSQDETLYQLVKARRTYQSSQATTYSLKKLSSGSYKGSKKIIKGSYNLANRSYNLARGSGFRKTPEAFSWYKQLRDSVHKRLAKNNMLKHAKGLKKQIDPLFMPINRFGKNVLRNPFSIFGMLNLLGILMIVAPFMSVGTLKQNEFDMTDTWVYFTKLDREKSTDSVKYWSDIDDMLFYINHQYDTIRKNYPLDTSKSMPDGVMGKSYLNMMWSDLNNNPDKLKTMKDLYSVPGEYHLKDKALDDYNNKLTMANEIGKYIQMNDLSNFLVNHTSQSNKVLKIISRHGYVDKKTLSDTSIFKVEAGATLYASMKGSIKIIDNTVEITNDKRRLSYFNVDKIRVSDGQEVRSGDIIGQVNTNGNQIMKYEKLGKSKSGEKNENGEIKEEWRAVNIGFYLPAVTYTQKTSIIPKTNISKDKAQRVRAFVKSLKERLPQATNEGIAAILGNFDIESGVNPKMAEGDHLAPPVGKTDDTSYDNADWLNIGGISIYGKYSNILRRGIGLGQWTDTTDGSTRHTLLRQFAETRGKKWYDLEIQVDFMLYGDTPYYKQVFQEVATSTEDVAVLSERFLDDWEGNPGDKVEQRLSASKEWFTFIAQSGSGQPLNTMEEVMVTSYFGEFRQFVSQNGQYYEDVHNGIDLVYKDGRSKAPIYAIEDGEVVLAGDISEAGLSVVIKHNDYYSYYYHLSAITVNKGDLIKSGDTLGNMGNTGAKTTGEHLHFGLSKGYFSQYYDPKPYLQLP